MSFTGHSMMMCTCASSAFFERTLLSAIFMFQLLKVYLLIMMLPFYFLASMNQSNVAVNVKKVDPLLKTALFSFIVRRV